MNEFFQYKDYLEILLINGIVKIPHLVITEL